MDFSDKVASQSTIKVENYVRKKVVRGSVGSVDKLGGVWNK